MSRHDVGNGRAPLRLVELVGPAGAGKSALVRALRAGAPGISPHFTLWGLPRRVLLASAVTLVPTHLRALLGGHPLRSAELAQMVRLGALDRLLKEPTHPALPLILLDEGPVFGLSWLEVFHAANGNRARTDWRRRALEEWASRLAAVVRVDAPDDVLVERIKRRAKPHPLKHDPAESIYGFTARFRGVFDRVIEDLAATGRVRVIELRTDQGSPLDNAARLRTALQGTLA